MEHGVIQLRDERLLPQAVEHRSGRRAVLAPTAGYLAHAWARALVVNVLLCAGIPFLRTMALQLAPRF